jgi:hypothetical protein
MILNILGTAAILFVMVAPNSQWNGPTEGWARIVGAALVLLAIWL